MLLIYIYSVGIMCQCLKILLFLLSFLSVFPPHFNPFLRGGFWIGAREKKREGACFPLEVKTALEPAGAGPQAAACASQAEASYFPL